MRHRSLTATSLLASAAAAAVLSISGQSVHGQTLFTDNFETGTFAANYDVFSSNAASDFSAGYVDYTTLSYQLDDGLGGTSILPVPAAPGGAGTNGLLMRINDTSGAVNSMSAYPKLQSFSGNYRVKFDMFISYNGPAGGGTASTEWMLAGINQGQAGNRVAGPTIVTGIGGTNTGVSMAVTGEGGNGQDYRTWVNQANQGTRGFAAQPFTPPPPPTPPVTISPQNNTNPYYADPSTGLFPSPQFESAGSPGKNWVTVEISQVADVITWKMNGRVISAYADTTNTSGNLTLGYMDLVASSVAPGDVQFQYVVYDNVGVTNDNLYWDTNGTAAGAGGATPTGAWDGSAANFNSDATGGAAGTTGALTGANNAAVFTAGADGTSSYTVNVSGTQSAAAVQVARGNVTFAGGTIATSTLNAATGASATVNSVVAGAGAGVGLTKTGGGSVTITAANTYTGGTTVFAGTLVAGSPNAIPAGQALTVGAGATMRSQAGQLTALDVSTLSVNATGRIDLNDGGLVKRNGGSGATGQTSTQQLRALIKTGLENGGNFDWLGPGISSTEAASDNALAGSVLYGIGIIQNNVASAQVGDGTTTDETPGNEIYPTFKGRTVGLNDTLVRYTYMGDSDLDGAVTGTDYTLIDNGFAFGLSGWINGDYDYSGAVDGTDYTLIDNAFAFQVGPLSEAFQERYALSVARFGQAYIDSFAALQAGGGALPEPGTLAGLVVAGAALLIRRRAQ